MRQGLQLAFGRKKFRSLNHLLQKCIKMENTWTRLKYNPDYSFASKKTVFEIKDDSVLKYPSVHHDDIYVLNTNSLKCWNCKGTHKYQECTSSIRNVFCYGCGAAGIYLPKCTKCRPRSGNFQGEARNPGNLSYPKNLQNLPSVDQVDCASNTDPELQRQQ